MRGDLPHPKPRKDTQVKHLSHPWYLLYNLIIKKKNTSSNTVFCDTKNFTYNRKLSLKQHSKL